MNRPNRPIITDSGGFQVFSLAYGSVQESLQSEGELKRANTKKNSRWNSHTMNGKNQVTVTEVRSLMMKLQIYVIILLYSYRCRSK